MGKVRIKTFGDEEAEAKAAEKTRIKKEQKAAKQSSGNQLSVVSDQLSDSSQPVAGESDKPETDEQVAENRKPKTEDRKTSSYAAKKKKARRSQKYQTISKQVERARTYSISDALELLEKSHLAKFDETVELHINTIESGITGTLSLPHGTGKKTRVAIATDEVLAEVEKGKIDFDVLVAHPSQMPKLARVAKYLGPRGLMPNPKNGTVTTTPEEVVKKYEGGLTQFKTENKLPVIHLTVGKLSIGPDKLKENIKTAIGSVKTSNMLKVVLKSTMSPGIKLDFSNI